MTKLATAQRGFTLVEMLIYLGLYAIIMTGALVSVYAILSSSAHNQANAMVQEEGAFLIGKIDWVLTNTQTITSPASNASGSVLDVSRFDGSTVRLALVGDDVQISENGTPAQTLNNTNVFITNLVFEYAKASADGLNPERVQATFTITTRTSDGLSFERNFTTLKYLRK